MFTTHRWVVNIYIHTYIYTYIYIYIYMYVYICLLPTGSEEREVLGGGTIPVAILPSRQDMKYIAL